MRALSRVRSLLKHEAANAVAVCLILSKLDYCNSLLVGLPQAQIKRLQAVWSSAASVVVRQRKRDHITPTIRELYWLPVRNRILYKLLSATYRSVHDPAVGSCGRRKLKSHLVRTQSLNVLPLKPGIGHYIAIHGTLTARDFFLAYFYPSGPFTCIFSKTCPDFFLFWL